MKKEIPSRIKDNREHGAFLSIQSYISFRTFAATPWEQKMEGENHVLFEHIFLFLC